VPTIIKYKAKANFGFLNPSRLREPIIAKIKHEIIDKWLKTYLKRKSIQDESTKIGKQTKTRINTGRKKVKKDFLKLFI